jgi:hypothetical protein
VIRAPYQNGSTTLPRTPASPIWFLAMISVLLAATIVFILSGILASSRNQDLQRRVVKLRCGEAEAAMDVVGVRRKGSQFRSWVVLQLPAMAVLSC